MSEGWAYWIPAAAGMTEGHIPRAGWSVGKGILGINHRADFVTPLPLRAEGLVVGAEDIGGRGHVVDDGRGRPRGTPVREEGTIPWRHDDSWRGKGGSYEPLLRGEVRGMLGGGWCGAGFGEARPRKG